MKMNKKILATAALVLPLTIGTGSALAYFTANTVAAGGASVAVGTDTEIIEDVSSMTKHVTIRNKEDGGAVYVRVMAYTDSLHTLTYTGADWTENGDYYDYNKILEPGASTSPLDIKIKANPGVVEADDFNVIVIYEQTPVEYVTDKDGNTMAKPADWSKAKAVRTEETLPAVQTPGTGNQNQTTTETTGSGTGTETPEKGGDEG